LTKYKRIDAVIRAVALLPEWSLLIIGQGEEQSNLTKLAQEVIPGRFQIIEVPHDLIASYYRASDVFVLASEPQEAFGMVLLEAQACGLPIVTTNDESRRWILGESAIFVNPQSKEELAHAIADASKNLNAEKSYGNIERFSNELIEHSYRKLFDTFT
jgi:glycosyltransferase involved in cell wall biosynthesis